jgi:hypothetical protein
MTSKDKRPAVEDIEDASEDYFDHPPAPQVPATAATDAPFATPGKVTIRREGDTEDLLNGMIAECHYYMRAVVLPSATRATDVRTRMQFVESAMDLAKTGAAVGKAVARLRLADAEGELAHMQAIAARAS